MVLHTHTTRPSWAPVDDTVVAEEHRLHLGEVEHDDAHHVGGTRDLRGRGDGLRPEGDGGRGGIGVHVVDGRAESGPHQTPRHGESHAPQPDHSGSQFTAHGAHPRLAAVQLPVRHRRVRNVALAEQLAKRRLPRSVYDFVRGGTEGELTVRDNLAAFQEVEFRPHAAVETRDRVLATTVVGCELSMPVIVAPTGMVRIVHRDGEVGAARAAGRAGTAIGISTLSSYPIEDITAATSGPVFYQVYFAGGRTGAGLAIDRARDAGCRAVIVTVDTAAAAGREERLRGGAIPRQVDLRTALRYAPEMVTRPRGSSTSCVAVSTSRRRTCRRSRAVRRCRRPSRRPRCAGRRLPGTTSGGSRTASAAR